MKKNEKNDYFWVALLSEVMFEDRKQDEINAMLGMLCKKKVRFPDGSYKHPNLRTLKRKYEKLKKKGMEGLKREKRKDKGETKKYSKAIITRAIELKKEEPRRGAKVINDLLESEFKIKLPKSSLYKHLKTAGATKIKLDATKKKVRKRWTRKESNDLWVGDFSDGPYVMHSGKSQKTYLSAFIDCHSRYCVSARYYFRQNSEILADTMIKGWVINGVPRQVYIDNAKVYHSKILINACLKNNVKILYRPIKDPAPGGLIERFFKTVQNQFELEVKKESNLSLNQLNQYFLTWFNTYYNKSYHSGIKDLPENIYNSDMKCLKKVSLNDASEAFLLSKTRTVNKDFSDVSLNGKFYRVDKKLRTDKVVVKYNPFDEELESVFIYSLNDEYLGTGTKHHREKGEKLDNEKPKSVVKSGSTYINLLKNKQREELEKTNNTKEKYTKIKEKKIPLNAFILKIADLSGRKKSVASFNNKEINIIENTYNKTLPDNFKLLYKSYEQTEKKDLHKILKCFENLCFEEIK